jgi:hypothetical protein
MQKLLKLIIELNSILYGKSSQCQKCLEASIQDMFNRRSRDKSSGVVPALEDLPVDLLYLPKAYKNVFWRHSVGEGLITTVVDELDGKLLNPMRAAMVFSGGKTGDIKYANPTRSSQAFLVARAWQCDGSPHVMLIRTILRRASASRSIQPHVLVDRG